MAFFPCHTTKLKLENLKFLEIIQVNKRLEYHTSVIVVVTVCVVSSVMGGVGIGSTSRRCFGREGMSRRRWGRGWIWGYDSTCSRVRCVVGQFDFCFSE